MEIKAIRTETDYLAALSKVAALIEVDQAPDTPDGEGLDVLRTLVQAYEVKHYPPDLIGAIKFRMDQEGMASKIWRPTSVR